MDHTKVESLDRVFEAGWAVGALVRFHTAHKLLLMAHSPAAYRRLGRLVAAASGLPPEVLADFYTSSFSAALAVAPSRGRHVNVLQHAAGYFKDCPDPRCTADLAAAIDDYRRGVRTRPTVIRLIRHYAALYGVTYLAGQVYLNDEGATGSAIIRSHHDRAPVDSP